MTGYAAPDPGPGWRLLKVGEVIPSGETFWSDKSWVETTLAGDKHRYGENAYIPMFYRTREGVKPTRDPLTRALKRILKAKNVREARGIAEKALNSKEKK